MLSEKGLRIEQAINNEWAKSHIYRPLDYARMAAQAVLALERQADSKPCSVCGDGGIEYCMKHGPGKDQPVLAKHKPEPAAQTCLKCGNTLGCISCHHENIVKARKLAEDTEAEPRTKPGLVEQTFTLEQVFAILNKALTVKVWGSPAECVEWIRAALAPKPQEQVIVSKNSVLIDGNVCATFSGKDSLDAAQDYARLRIARLAEIAKEASNG